MSLKNTINKIFGKTDPDVDASELTCGDIFGVAAGTYVGKFFVYIKSDDNGKHFIILPDMSVEILTNENFTTGVENKVLEYQETLPEQITQYCKEQYEKKSNN